MCVCWTCMCMCDGQLLYCNLCMWQQTVSQNNLWGRSVDTLRWIFSFFSLLEITWFWACLLFSLYVVPTQWLFKTCQTDWSCCSPSSSNYIIEVCASKIWPQRSLRAIFVCILCGCCTYCTVMCVNAISNYVQNHMHADSPTLPCSLAITLILRQLC